MDTFVSSLTMKGKNKMGTWRLKLDDDDISSDVRYEYKDLLRQGIENEEVTKRLIKRWDTEDVEDGPIFWFALADIQWEYGRLLEYVKNKALYYIENETDLERWKEDEKLYNKRKEILEKLEKKLKSPMPEPKRIVKRRNYVCPWKIGDIYAYQIKNNEEHKGKYICIIKVSEEDFLHDICPIVYVYNKIFDEIPQIEELKNIKYLPQFFVPSVYKGKNRGILYKCLIGITNYRKRMAEDCIFVGNIKNYLLPSNETTDKLDENYLCLIERFEEFQIEFYNDWKGEDY